MELQSHLMESSVGRIGTLDKLIRVLGEIADHPDTLTGLTIRLQQPKPSVHRMLAALESHRLVRRNEDGVYALGSKWIAYGHIAAAANPVLAMSTEVLSSLRDETQESVQLYVLDGAQRLCLAAWDSPHELRTIVAPGTRLTLNAGSAARALTERTLTHGWVASVEERQVGVASVSAPVHDSAGHVTAAVSVSGPIERFGRDPGERFGQRVHTAAREISRRLASMQ
jgi:DNA-binding IclR family transcriptional regulator